jgi:hypothetical protein
MRNTARKNPEEPTLEQLRKALDAVRALSVTPRDLFAYGMACDFQAIVAQARPGVSAVTAAYMAKAAYPAEKFLAEFTGQALVIAAMIDKEAAAAKNIL